MPPKAKPSSTAQKKQVKAKVEDKTFGLKNKNKSSKVQKYVAQVSKQVAEGGMDTREKRRQDEAAKLKAEKKKRDEESKAEMDELFQTVQTAQKVPFGVDPKTVVCIYFKKGTCTKGSKCKFSHDLGVERKAEKKNLYEDIRANDTMEDWDDAKLREVVLNKHGNVKTTTDIVCKHFLEAVEQGKYGWFWTCPNGGDTCKYRHSLPPGFVLKTKEQRALEREAAKNAPTITLEDFLEVERHKLRPPLNPVTLESFEIWKKTRTEMKIKSDEESRLKRENEVRAGKGTGISGRELFEFDPSMLQDSDSDDDGEAWDFAQFNRAMEEGQSNGVNHDETASDEE